MEKERLLKSGEYSGENSKKGNQETLNGEVVETRVDTAKGLNFLNENAEVLGMGNVNEDDEGTSRKPGEGVAAGNSSQNKGKAQQGKYLPSVEVMIKQTSEAIEAELLKKVEETERMRKSKKYTNSQLNESVKQIRYLNGILAALKNAAKLAEDFVIGLWKQFVKKA
jgi:hypothetical protein